ncbi:UDP-N-acetylmuramate dehydrogenase [Anthocerotibacter panamensis]|uniref:UDP-N-acetylmuramate dehydrogenase n=1 Tax=Anthocerotibacter panamensis TaxID=2857077 RepID=UPI001C408870|nr:UDP-N-acetylmuramate dehydrogenase [Anthocerotibacter panamensis]
MFTPRAQVSLAPFTAYHVGGKAQWFSQPRDLVEVHQALAWAKEQAVPVTVLGAGTNLLISDQGISGLVLHLRQLQGICWGQGGQIRVAAGESLASLVWQSARRGWHGLEWAVGIPGSVGGAVVMNAGAHGWETQQVLHAVEVVDRLGNHRRLSLADLEFGYRHSTFQDRDWIVLAVELQLEAGQDAQLLLHQVETYNRHRHQTQPQGFPNCGSVFRNPAERAAGWFLEHAGLKGYRIGGAEVACLHANFILNRERAKAEDIWFLMRHMHGEVQARWNIHLEQEVKLLGKFP